MWSNLRFATPPDESLLAAPSHIDSATLYENNYVFGALAAKTIQNGKFAGTDTKNHNVHDRKNVLGPAGSGAAKNANVLYCFRADYIRSEPTSHFV